MRSIFSRLVAAAGAAAFTHAMLLCVFSETAAAEPIKLRYQWKAGETIAYEVHVTADRAESVEELKGMIHYRVDSANADQAKLVFSGGVTKTSKPKVTDAPRGRRGFGPPRIGRPDFGRSFDPFYRSPFTGLGHTTNELTVTSRGQALSMKGSSQLPYLLGNLSLLVFEPLADDPEEAWNVHHGITISEGGGRSSGPPFFRSPFDSAEEEKTTAGSEVIDFKIEKTTADSVVVSKTYKLTSPAADGEESHEITATGTWTFNRKTGMPDSLDQKQELIVRQGNITMTVPMTVKFRRLTADELAKIQAEAQKRREEAERVAAEAKAKAEAPLEPAKKEELLTSLKSGDVQKMLASLNELEQKSPKESDKEVVAAITPLLKNVNKTVADAAEKALVKWSPEFKKKVDLNRAYKGPAFTKESGLPVGPDTKLQVGQILIGHDTGAWYPAEIVALNSDGTVAVTFRGWGSRSSTLPRSKLQLAPPEVDQPNLVASGATSVAATSSEKPAASSGKTMRTWTDSSNRFTIEAEYLRTTDGNVKLRRADGKELTVPLAKLSTADQEVLASQPKESENPFDQ